MILGPFHIVGDLTLITIIGYILSTPNDANYIKKKKSRTKVSRGIMVKKDFHEGGTVKEGQNGKKRSEGQ